MIYEKGNEDDFEQETEQDQACFLSLIFVLVMLALKGVYEDKLDDVIGMCGVGI